MASISDHYRVTIPTSELNTNANSRRSIQPTWRRCRKSISTQMKCIATVAVGLVILIMSFLVVRVVVGAASGSYAPNINQTEPALQSDTDHPVVSTISQDSLQLQPPNPATTVEATTLTTPPIQTSLENPITISIPTTEPLGDARAPAFTTYVLPKNAEKLSPMDLIQKVFKRTGIKYTEIKCKSGHPPTFKGILKIEGVPGAFVGESRSKRQARSAAFKKAAEVLFEMQYRVTLPPALRPCEEDFEKERKFPTWDL